MGSPQVLVRHKEGSRPVTYHSGIYVNASSIASSMWPIPAGPTGAAANRLSSRKNRTENLSPPCVNATVTVFKETNDVVSSDNSMSDETPHVIELTLISLFPFNSNSKLK